MRAVPHVTVDLNGSTPFDTNNFFKVTFSSGSTSFLKSMTVDLAPVSAFFDPTGSPPGFSGTPFQTSSLVGLLNSDISVSGNTDGSKKLTLNFADNAFKAGDSFNFGIDIDLDNCVDCFGATPAELAGALFSFTFSDGFGSQAAMSGTSFMADSTDILNLLPFDASLLQTPPGFTPPVGTLGPSDPVGAPEPGSVALLGLAFSALLAARRRREVRA